MKRTGFKRKNNAENIPKKVAQSYIHKAQEAIKCIAKTATTYTPISTQFRGSIPKSKPVRSEAYRRAVASLPCCICGIAGYSQAAHGSGVGTATCKGMGIKSCDLTCFPACAIRCHPALDQGALFSKAVRHELEPVWAADTQRKIRAMGKWPVDLPMIENNPATN